MGQHATIHGKTTVPINGASGSWAPIQTNVEGQLIIAKLAGEDPEADVLVVQTNGPDYETVAASSTDQVLGATGAVGDYLGRLVCVVTTVLTSTVSIKDGSGSSISILPANVTPGIGTYVLDLGIKSIAGAWSVTTGAGVSVVAIGAFT